MVSPVMPKVGLEPTRPFGHRILSPARLPVPPLRRQTQDSEVGSNHSGHGDVCSCRTRGEGGYFALASGRASSTKEEGLLRKKPLLAILPIAVAAVGLSIAGAASGKTGPAAVSKLPSSSCSPIFYKGSGSPRYLIASDLPLQGAGRAQPLSMVKAIQYVMEKQFNFRAGTYTVGYQSCDDATAQQGGWATEKCTANARAYAQMTGACSPCWGRSTRDVPSSRSRS